MIGLGSKNKKALWVHSEEEEANKVWETGQGLGVRLQGNKEAMIQNRVLLQKRDYSQKPGPCASKKEGTGSGKPEIMSRARKPALPKKPVVQKSKREQV